MNLTPAQQNVLMALSRRLLRGTAPSLGEIGEEAGRNREHVRACIVGLEKRGLVDRVHGRRRSVVLTEEGRRLCYGMRCPTCGHCRVSA